MTDLQKDQAIYQAMLEIANKVFNDAMESNKGIQSLIKDYGGLVSLTDINKYNGDFSKEFITCAKECQSYTDIHEVNVDTFHCSFPGCEVFSLLKVWKSLAKVKAEPIFTYEEKIQNRFIGSVEVNIEDGNNAKLLAKHTANDELRPVMNYVLAEINATTQNINFVASDGHTLAVISNDKSLIFAETDRPQTIFQALFSRDDWKRICDFTKKSGGKVLFDIYKANNEEAFDTFNVHLGDTVMRSKVENWRYPNWKSVIPKPEVLKHRFDIVPEEWKAAQDWINKLKADSHRYVNVSFYRGSDLVYFDYDDYDFSKTMTATFHLTRPSDVTIGVAYSLRSMPTIKFTGFNIEDYDHVTTINCEEADIMLVCPVTDNDCRVRDVENRERHLQVWQGVYARWQNLNGDFANVRVEAVNPENGTATIRTWGWNRYKVDIDALEWTWTEGYTFPKWVCVGQYIQSENICGTITDVGRTYVTLDGYRLVSYKDLFGQYVPSKEPVAELQAA